MYANTYHHTSIDSTATLGSIDTTQHANNHIIIISQPNQYTQYGYATNDYPTIQQLGEQDLGSFDVANLEFVTNLETTLGDVETPHYSSTIDTITNSDINKNNYYIDNHTKQAIQQPQLAQIDYLNADEYQTINLDANFLFNSATYNQLPVQLPQAQPQPQQQQQQQQHDQTQYNSFNFDLGNNVVKANLSVDVLNKVLTQATSEFEKQNEGKSSRSKHSSLRKQAYEAKTAKVKGRDSPIKCRVCEQNSSGYHYGAYTCEACKLFFRRTVKQLRKTDFNECKTKNCRVNFENRSNCSACRYKKCISVGMSMSRSKFGRHTEKLCSDVSQNLSESLCSLLSNLKLNYAKHNTNLTILNHMINEFYYNSIKLLDDIVENDEEENSNDGNNPKAKNYYGANTLTELSSVAQNAHQIIKLPNSVIILFCVLFGLSIDKYLFYTLFSVEKQNTIIKEYEEFIRFTEEEILHKNKFVPILRIGLFIKIMALLIEKEIVKDDVKDKKIADLMRAELALFKFESSSSSASSSFTSKQTSNLNKPNDLKNNEYFGQSSLGLIFTNINSIIFKHMSYNELDNFLL